MISWMKKKTDKKIARKKKTAGKDKDVTLEMFENQPDTAQPETFSTDTLSIRYEAYFHESQNFLS